METFLPESVKAILLGLIATAFVLSRLAHWFPHVAWLQVFRLPVIQMSEEQRAKRRRFGNRMAGLEMVFAGVVLPLVYFASTIGFSANCRRYPRSSWLPVRSCVSPLGSGSSCGIGD